MSLIPEFERALAAAAAKKPRRRRAQRRAAVAGVALAGCLGGTAVAAGVLDFRTEVGSGRVDEPTLRAADQQRYSVKANVRGDRVCLSIDLDEPGRRSGGPSSCSAQPISQPLDQVALTVVGNGRTRLVTGIVTDAVGSLQTDTGLPVALHRLDGLPGATFDFLVTESGPVVLVARDTDLQEISRFDSSTFGPIGRGELG